MFNKKVFCSLAGRGLACHIFEEKGWKCVRLLMTSLPHLRSLRFWVPFESTNGPRGLGKGLATLPMQPQSISIRLSLGFWLTKCSPEADLLENHTWPKRSGQGAASMPTSTPTWGAFLYIAKFPPSSLSLCLPNKTCVCQTKVFWFFSFLPCRARAVRLMVGVDAQNRFKQIWRGALFYGGGRCPKQT